MTEQPDRDTPDDLIRRQTDDVEVFDAEIVDEPDTRVPLLIGRRIPRPPTYLITALPDRAKLGRAPRAVARAGYIAGQGGVSWAKRAGAAATHGLVREQIRVARAAGDREALAVWFKALEDAKKARNDRLRALPQLVQGIGIGAAAILLVLGVGLFVGGLSVQFTKGGATWNDWWAGVGGVLSTIGTILSVLAVIAVWAGPAWLFWAAWKEGRRVAAPPIWLIPPALRRSGDEITPSAVVIALRDLGIAALTKAIKEMGDAGGGMLSPIRIAGCGDEVDVTLPSGVSTAEILKRRRKLAENLTRYEHEVHLSVSARRVVGIWAAFPGALDEPIGPSPLAVDDTITADLYTGGAPWGQNLRGDAAAIALLQRHLLITGLSNQGKTASLRALVLWLTLDVTCEFRIADLKGIGDWHMFAPLAEVLIEGPADEHVIAATEMLENAVQEMERRLAALDKDKYPNGVTRELARKPGSGFHPIFNIVDEAQQAFMCPAVGEDRRPYGGTKATSRYFMAARKIHNQGRAVNVHLWQGTQDPTDQNLPKLVREGAHIRACLAVGTEAQAKMALGDKAVNGGAAPHLLRQGLDKGVLVMNGEGVVLPAGQSSLTIRTHFVDGDDATEIANRAVALRKRGRRGTRLHVVEDQGVDHLAAVREALRGEPRVRTAVLLGRLIEADAALYEPWGFQELKAALDAEHVPIRKSDGHSVVRADDVEAAVQHRALGAG